MKRQLMLAAALALFAAPALAATHNISVTNVWSRPAVETGVVYFTIRNYSASADQLLDATSPVAQRVELHQTVSAGPMHSTAMGSPMSGMAMGSPMPGVEMRRVHELAIPAEGSVTFTPGGYHVMLIGLRHPLAAGQSVPLRLRFARAGWISVHAQVRNT